MFIAGEWGVGKLQGRLQEPGLVTAVTTTRQEGTRGGDSVQSPDYHSDKKDIRGREQYLKIRDRKSGEEVFLKGAVTFGRGISQAVCVIDFTLSSFLLTSCQHSLLTKAKRKLVGKGHPSSPQILFFRSVEQTVKSGKGTYRANALGKGKEKLF